MKDKELFKCPSCRSVGFDKSIIKGRCEVCDGTVGGQEIEKREDEAWDDEILKGKGLENGPGS